MRFDVITLFPEMITDAAHYGVVGRALDREIVSLQTWNPRDFTEDRHRTVDDRSYGGGPGMVMMYPPLHKTLAQVKSLVSREQSRVVYLSPQGKPINQALILEACKLEQLVLLAGRYEGIDERLIEDEVDEEWSLGDFVISGGELGALVVMDAITRLLPGVLGDAESALQDSYMNGLLDCPHYTRPEVVNNKSVPEVLLSGNHAKIARWREQQALGRTWLRRPDLLDRIELNAEQEALLDEFKINKES